jgi:hypothetical protein
LALLLALPVLLHSPLEILHKIAHQPYKHMRQIVAFSENKILRKFLLFVITYTF